MAIDDAMTIDESVTYDTTPPEEVGSTDDLVADVSDLEATPDEVEADLGADSTLDGAAAPCRPQCVERVFGPCDYPAAGSCVRSNSPSETDICYSNGVREVAQSADGGGVIGLVTLLEPDGTTVCGYIQENQDSTSIYYDGNRTEIARVQVVAPNAKASDLIYTCDGQTITITAAQQQSPACLHVEAASCVTGQCP